jgi:hypothetical protein
MQQAVVVLAVFVAQSEQQVVEVLLNLNYLFLHRLTQ